MLRRVIDAAVIVSLLGVIGWSIAPPHRHTEPPSEQTRSATTNTHARGGAPLDVAAFDRTLWHTPPPPPVLPPPPKPPEMPRLELVGIIREGDTLRAMIADAAGSELRIVSAGDTFGVTRILAVTEGGVRCRAHERDFELLLDAATGGVP